MISVIAFVIGVLATRDGVNYFMDSTWYMVYARNVQEGHGLSAAITSNLDPQTTTWINQWPPLYPLFLALGGDPLQLGHISSTLLLAVTALLTYALTLTLLPGQRLVGVLAAFVLLTFPALSSQVFSSIYSETLFVPLVLGATVLLVFYRFGEPAPLITGSVAALLIALACLTRYIGVAFAGMGFVYLLLWARTVQQPRRWWPALTMLLALLPVAVYLVYLYNLTGSFTGVQTTSNQTALGDIPQSIQVILLQMLHGFQFALRQVGLRSNYWVLGVGLLLMLALLIYNRRYWPMMQSVKLDSRYLLLLLYLMGYMGLFWLLAIRSDAVGSHDQRHFVVVYPVLIVLLAVLLSQLTGGRVVVALVLVLYTISGFSDLRYNGDDLNYNTAVWETDPVVNALPEIIPPNTLVHGQDVGYLAYNLGDEVPVRMFGGDFAFQNYACSDLVYVTGYDYAAFTLMYSPMLREQPAADVEKIMRQWAEPCGTVQEFVQSDFAMVLVVELNNMP